MESLWMRLLFLRQPSAMQRSPPDNDPSSHQAIVWSGQDSVGSRSLKIPFHLRLGTGKAVILSLCTQDLGLKALV